MSSWFSSVLGSSLGSAAVEVPDAASKEDQGEPPASDSTGFSDRVTYWTSMAASVGSSLAKDSGFALVDRVGSGSFAAVGDASKELTEIEASCKSIITGVAEPTAIWKRWAARMDVTPLERFYDGLAHEDVSLKTIILRSSALDVAVSTILRKPSYASDQDQSLLEFFDRILVGSRAGKADVVAELVKLADNVDGTASHDKIQALVISALQQAKCDHRFDDAQRETKDLLRHVAVKVKELRALAHPGDADAPPQDAGTDTECNEHTLLDLPLAGPEVGDDELRERVARSSELLDTNASLRHLVTIGGALLQDRASRSSFATHALQEVARLREHAGAHITSVQARIEGATEERKLVAQVRTTGNTYSHTHILTHTLSLTHTPHSHTK